jgi:MOSC domain-containing protein YiiM
MSTPLSRGLLLSVQTGRVQRMTMPEETRVDFRHANWESGIFKSAVARAVRVSQAGMEGDEQSDLDNHGGPDNVVLAYDAAHYPVWRERLGMPEMRAGYFGENFTVEGFSDETVCVGDVWEVGSELVLQVTQARQPCYKLARRLRQPHIVKMVRENSWGGWYLRVLRAGAAEAGMEIRLVERLHAEWPVARAVQAMYGRKKDIATAKVLAALPELSVRWKRELLG